jgi:hypothetical protein
MEEEDVLPMPHMRGSDAEAGCGERSRSEDAQRHPLGERAELLEDDVVPRALRVDGDERESRATTQPNDHACDMKRHEQAVASHLVSSVNSPTARIFISLPPPAFSASESRRWRRPVVCCESRAAAERSNPPRREPSGRSAPIRLER